MMCCSGRSNSRGLSARHRSSIRGPLLAAPVRRVSSVPSSSTLRNLTPDSSDRLVPSAASYESCRGHVTVSRMFYFTYCNILIRYFNSIKVTQTILPIQLFNRILNCILIMGGGELFVHLCIINFINYM